jgi:hypothetical protein
MKPNKLQVTVHCATLDRRKCKNVFAAVKCAGQTLETETYHERTKNPEWQKTFFFPVVDSSASVSIELKHKILLMSKTIGQVSINIKSFSLHAIRTCV